MSGETSFFGPLPSRPEPDPPGWRKPWYGPPVNELGVQIPISFLLARTSELAVGIVGGFAYSTGFTVIVGLRVHPESELAKDQHLSWSQQGLARMTHIQRGRNEDDIFRFGVEFSDGRKATNLDLWWSSDEEPPIAIGHPGASGAVGGISHDLNYWVYPLPPPGPVRIAIEWPSASIALTATTFDATVVTDAASTTQAFWEIP